MKIMSLNVNQFQVLRLSEGYWAKDIIALVKRFLSMDPDHVLVSPGLKAKNRVTAYVIPQEILELSDHAGIIVDVQI